MQRAEPKRRQLATAAVVAFLLAAATSVKPAEAQSSNAERALTLPAGTRIELMLVRPLAARTAKTGDTVYGQTDYPVTAGETIALPAGTWVQGRVEAVIPPTRRQDRAVLDLLFTKIIFAGGYVASLPDAAPGAPLPPNATEMRVTIQVSRTNDLLLDNGAPIEVVLGSPLRLNPEAVARAIPLTHAPLPANLKSATLCRPMPGTPGSSDTVIPGSPGTPDTVIPGGRGMSDTVIPGTPATPSTVIPGTPGTPGMACPPAPVVLSSAPVLRQAANPAVLTTPH